MLSRGIDPLVDDPSQCHRLGTAQWAARWQRGSDVLSSRPSLRADLVGRSLFRVHASLTCALP